jgi:hypothetical protein
VACLVSQLARRRMGDRVRLRPVLFAPLLASWIVRLAEKDRLAAIDKQGARLFEPIAGRPMREYIVLPEVALANREELAAWLQRGFRYATSLPPKAKTGRKAKPAAAGAARKRT